MADTELNALTAATAATGGIYYGEQSGASRKFTVTAAGATLMEAANVAAQRTALGLATGDSPQFTALNIGAATDTTLTRVSAGVIAVEGSTILVSGGALGTPSGGTLTSCTGLPVSTGISGLGTGVATALAAGASTGGNGATDSGKVAVFTATGAMSFGKSDAAAIVQMSGNNPAASSLVVHQYGAGGYVITSFSHANSLGGFHHLGNGINENAVEAVFATTAEGCVGLAVDFDSSGGHATAIGMDLYMAGLGYVLKVDTSVYTITALGVHNFLSTTPAANATAITVSSATHTTSAPVLDAAQTWNAVGTTFTAVKLNVTNTASAAGSLLMDLQVGGSSVLNIGKAGTVNFATGGTVSAPVLSLAAGGNGIWSSSSGAIDFEFSGTNSFELASHGRIFASGSNNDAGFYVTSGAPDVTGTTSGLVYIGSNVWKFGLDGAGPTSHRITTGDRIASDGVGANLTISGGNGLGGAGGSVILSTYTTAGASTAGTLTTRLTLDTTGLLTFADAVNMAFNATTGTKIGTATTQKIGFYNATPVVQQTASTALTDNTGGTPGSDLAGCGDTSLSNQASVINNNFATVLTQLNTIRTSLTNLGLAA